MNTLTELMIVKHGPSSVEKADSNSKPGESMERLVSNTIARAAKKAGRSVLKLCVSIWRFLEEASLAHVKMCESKEKLMPYSYIYPRGLM